MGCVVVHDQVDIKLLWDVGVDVVQNAHELLVTVSGLAFMDDFPGGDVQGRKQGGRAVSGIIVGDAFEISHAQRQYGLGAVQGLNLTFFVHAQYQGLIRRVDIKPYDVTDLLDEKLVIGKL